MFKDDEIGERFSALEEDDPVDICLVYMETMRLATGLAMSFGSWTNESGQ